MRLILVSDLDGTLLNHHDYSFAAAQPALEHLQRLGLPLILATSKTAAEVAELHAAMQLGSAPAIIENGAGVFRPGVAMAASADDYSQIRDALAHMPKTLRKHFHGFGDMSDADVADLTGLSADGATRARSRIYSEPGLWTGDADAQAAFLQHLAGHGIHARQGGRFLTLSFGRSKADALQELRQELEANTVIALGDAPNDIEMLEAADYAVIVRNDHGPELPPLQRERETSHTAGPTRVRRTTRPGPEGWNQAVFALLRELGL